MKYDKARNYYLLQESRRDESLFLDEILSSSDIKKSLKNSRLLEEYVKAQDTGDHKQRYSRKYQQFWSWKNNPEVPWEGYVKGRLSWGAPIPNLYCSDCDTILNEFFGITIPSVYSVSLPKQFCRRIDKLYFNRSERPSDDYLKILDLAHEIEDYYLANGVSLSLRPSDIIGIPVWDSPLYWDKYSVFGIFSGVETFGEPGFIFKADAFDSFNRAIEFRNLIRTRVKVRSRFCEVNKKFYCVTNIPRPNYLFAQSDEGLEICPKCGFRTLRTEQYETIKRERKIKANIRNSKLRKSCQVATSDLFDAPFFFVSTYQNGLVVEESFGKWLSDMDKNNHFKLTKLSVVDL